MRAFYSRLLADLKQESLQPVRCFYGDDFVVDESLYTGRINGRVLGLSQDLPSPGIQIRVICMSLLTWLAIL